MDGDEGDFVMRGRVDDDDDDDDDCDDSFLSSRLRPRSFLVEARKDSDKLVIRLDVSLVDCKSLRK